MSDQSTNPILGERKAAALSFLRLASAGDVERAFCYHLGADFRHHNPYFSSDPESLAKAMEENAAQNPEKIFQIEHVIADGDLVAVHSRVRMSPTASDIAVVHIFRFEGIRVVELWDIGQPAPQESPNENGMF